jgi:hypothetical protein
MRSQADALVIEAAAKRRLADEYDAAQERGEVARNGDNLPSVSKLNAKKPTAAEIGLSRKQIHEARDFRDAEEADPGVVRRTARPFALGTFAKMWSTPHRLWRAPHPSWCKSLRVVGMAISFLRKSPMEKLDAELAALRARAETLHSRHAAAEAAFVDAETKLQRHLLEADLDDDKVRAKLEVAVAACALTRDNFAKALAAQQVKVADAEQRQAAERAAVERKAASEKLARDLDAVERTLPSYLDAARAFTKALDELHHHFESSQMSAFISNAASQVEVAGAFALQELRANVRAIADGTMPMPPAKEVPAPVVVPEPAPEIRRVFALRQIKWKDAAGRQQYGQQYEDADLPLATAEMALRHGAVTRLDDDRRKQLRGARGGQHVNPNAVDLLDLDALEGWSGARHASFDPVASARITPFDRGIPERKISIPAMRAG